MGPIKFAVTPSFLVPKVDMSLTISPTWDSRKLKQLIRSVQDPRYILANFDKIDSLPVPLLVELFQSLNRLQSRPTRGSEVLSKTVYFDMTRLLQSPEQRKSFERGCLSTLSFIPPSISTQDKVFYSFWTHQRSHPL